MFSSGLNLIYPSVTSCSYDSKASLLLISSSGVTAKGVNILLENCTIPSFWFSYLSLISNSSSLLSDFAYRSFAKSFWIF